MINTKQILAHYGLTPNKALGQNFIEDENALHKILAAAKLDGRAVLEIGPGLGTLTQGLLERAAKVVAVEIDARLVAVLGDRFKDCKNLDVIHSDILKTDLADLHARLGGGEFIVAGNLPYHITTPICSMLTESNLPIAGMTLMVQQEAAQRFFAGPKDRIYGPMPAMIALEYEPKLIMNLPPQCYYPMPNVDSSVVNLRRIQPAEAIGALRARLVWTLHAAFAMRRKTITNNLMAAGLCRANVERILADAGIDPSARAETLEPSAFVRLAREIEALKAE